MASQLDRDNPWPGLESFDESARDYFHGREAEAEDLLRRVADAPLTVLFGKSGLGKTSLLKAGLFPRLREKHYLPVHVRLDIRPEAPGLIEQVRDGLLAEMARERVDAPPFAEGETLWEYLHRADLELWSEQNYPLTPVLVLDQFEEVFTLGERLPERVERFKTDLGDLAENRIPVALAGRLAADPATAQRLDLRRMSYKLVVTLREDFLPHLEGWRAAVPSLGRVRVRLLPMRPEQALSAVYDTAPHLMDPPLARRIVEFVAAAAQGEGGGEIEPALLSLFCRGLNERRKKQGSDRFDEQLLAGAQQSIIADYYRSCVEGLPDSVSRFIEADLITEKGFRNSYAKDDAVPGILTEGQLDLLINRRLLRVEERYGTARIELTHDLLTRAVMADRDLRRVEEEKAALVVQGRRQRRRLLAMGFVALVCLAFAGVAAWQWWAAVKAKRASEEATKVAVRAKTDAEGARAVAEKAKRAAQMSAYEAQYAESVARVAETKAQTQVRLAEESAAKELIARSSSEARRTATEAQFVFGDSGPALIDATRLSIESVRHARTVDGHISLTRFLRLFPRAPLWRRSVAGPADVIPGRGRRAIAVSPDGTRIAVIGESGPLQILNARTGQPVASFEVARNDAGRTVLAFSPDGAVLVWGCGHQACVIDAASGKLLTRLPSADAAHGSMVWSASFSPDGKSLAMASYGSGDVLVYDVATWRTTATIPGGGGTGSSVFSVAFSPEGAWLATAGPSGLQLWRAGHYEAPAAQASTGIAWSIAFQPKGLVVAGDNALQALRIVTSEGSATRLEAAASKGFGAHTLMPVSRYGRPCFVAAGRDAVHVLCNESLDEVLRIPVSSVAAAISPDTHWLFNEQNDGTLAAWPLEAGPEASRIRLGAPIQSMVSAEPRGWLATGLANGDVAIVGLDSLKERRRLRLAPETPVQKLTVSPDGRWLVAAQGTTLHVFDTGSWRKVASGTYGEEVTAAAFDIGGRWLVVVTGTTVVVWEPGGWRERRRLEHDGTIEAVRVSPSGRQLATTTHWNAGHDRGVELTRVFDLASGDETGWEYTADGGSNISRKFMEDEAARRQRALAGGDTASVRGSVSSWPELEFDEPHERLSADGLWKVAFSGPDLTLHDVAANRDIGTFEQGGQITGIRFVPARAPRWLVSAGDDGTLAVWPLHTDDLANEACARLRGILGPQALGNCRP